MDKIMEEAMKYADEDIEFEENMDKWVEEGTCMLCGSKMKVINHSLDDAVVIDVCTSPECPFRTETRFFME